jgi:hypothetical protein
MEDPVGGYEGTYQGRNEEDDCPRSIPHMTKRIRQVRTVRYEQEGQENRAGQEWKNEDTNETPP